MSLIPFDDPRLAAFDLADARILVRSLLDAQRKANGEGARQRVIVPVETKDEPLACLARDNGWVEFFQTPGGFLYMALLPAGVDAILGPT